MIEYTILGCSPATLSMMLESVHRLHPNDARVCIVLNTNVDSELPGARLILGMANKCLVVSEPIYDPGPHVPGEHFVACCIEEMPDRIRHYLDHAEERQKIVEAGHRLARILHELPELSVDITSAAWLIVCRSMAIAMVQAGSAGMCREIRRQTGSGTL